jgi:MFS family permease
LSTGAGASTGLREALGALSERPFRQLFFGRSISLLGSAFAPVALAFAVIDELDGTPSQLGLVLAAIWVPQVIFILVGGVWADRLPRNLVMVGTDLLMAGTQGAVALLLLTGSARIWHLVALQVVRGIASAFFFPASTGLVPTVVSGARLQQANALLRLAQSGSAVMGAALAGIVVAAAGSGWALAFDAATFVVSAGFLVTIRLPSRERIEAPSFLRELREGWREFSSRTWLWAIVVQFLFVNGFGHSTVLVLGPVIAKERLGGATAWGVILAAEAAGFVLGGLIALRWKPARMLLVATLTIFLFIPEPLLLAFAAPLVAVVAAAFVLGLGAETFGVLWDTTMQQQIPRDKLSRVYSYDALGSFVAIPIGLSIAGPVASLLGVEATLVLAAAVVFVPTVLVLLSRDVRTLRRSDAPVELAAEGTARTGEIAAAETAHLARREAP